MKRKPFTLLELSAAMAVLMIFMLFVMRFYNTSQDVMNRSASKTDQFERARIIMDMLAADLQNIYYTEGVSDYPFSPDDDGTSTNNLSFPVLRPQTGSNTATDLAFVTYSFDKTNYILKMGVAGDDQMSKWTTHLSGADLGVLAEGVLNFRVLPKKVDGSSTTAADTIPDYVLIELELMDGDDLAAYENAKKAMGASNIPEALDPSKSGFKGKDKTRSFFREVEIDRGQY